MARAFRMVQRSVKGVRRKAKRTYYVESVRECERVFEPHRMRRYGGFSRRPHALFASLGAAAPSRTWVHPRMSNPRMSNKMWECPKMSNALIN